MFSFTTNPTITITFDNQDARAKKNFKLSDKETVEIPIYTGQENISGVVDVQVPAGKKIEHQGIRIEMIGQTELYYDKGNNIKFTSLVRELETAGTMMVTKSYPFEFSTEKPYETYSGMNVRLRYFVRVTITRSYNTVVKEQDFAVQNSQAAVAAVANEAPAQGIKMEVGIEDCLHIEFEFDKQKYHLQDVILGKIYFLLVRIKIKFMELAVIRREAAGMGANSYNESENLIKHELMDGAPIKGECVPIRLFLSPLDLTPTYRSVNNIFSVKYYLNLVLVDEEDRRYFKQQEVVFWRKSEDAPAENNNITA
mmetsp:Transcript_66258/g.130391  ORF Transcript_66258/g.130391 Transcript_66258/m.130391 type:complete len:311 (+) Transcript_66258:96-1028(+)|eukprot:CAMPEP_0170385126 /NCGR_PEP_ID=MMETSP0117_2-20130122/16353_1 /TAXON_ID=400756 /ORGANISM="Durinskia baltica, Strain CSIRO CS-38" /LENGTH=310 /DNA_ID=CAMNT_0010640897 /DNA_START=91 /DNA_END=1023 /DNA_ORIENTATION=-